MYPDRVKPGSSAAERKLHAALATLSNDWSVIHSVAWQGNRNGKPADGEADFVLIHPRHGLLVIEVKGGGIRTEGGKWWSLNREGRHRIKDPFVQATDSQHALIRYLREAGKLAELKSAHAVALPDVSDRSGFGPHAPPAIVLNRSDLSSMEEAIERVVSYWQLSDRLEDHEVDTIIGLLSPTTRVMALLRDELLEIEARLLRLTQDQFVVLDALRRQRRALIIGGAGTGKTVLAIERSRRLAVDEFRVLLTCFNRPLGSRLAAEFAGNQPVTVMSFHQLVTWQTMKAGLQIPQPPDQDWWDRDSALALVEGAEMNKFSFDALVVDEGQDFAPNWFTALEILLTNSATAPFYVFADSHQAIYRPGWEPPFAGEPFELTVNCRNTIPIHNAVSRLFDSGDSSLGVEGPEPIWVAISSPEGAIKAVSKQLHRLLNEGGLRAAQVAVLTQSRGMADRLRSERRAGLTLVGLEDAGVVCETIHRFKGLEADAVIVVLDEMVDEQDRQLAYIGLSRARSLLVVIAPRTVVDALH
jgi:hypothetical protein